MGGNALNRYNVYTDRIDKETYDAIVLKIKEQLDYDGIICYIPEVINDKSDFGDIDILIKDHSSMYNYIKYVFKPDAIYANDKFFSFNVKYLGVNVQIDFINIPERCWDMKVYYTNDPVGNLMGNLARGVGLFYGDCGLYYKYNSSILNGTSVLFISRNPEEIFKFYGLDYERFLNGFDDVMDIYSYIINSRLFVKSLYQYENLSHNDRNRKSRRDNYNYFLSYIYDKNFPDQIKDLDKFDLFSEVKKYFNVDIDVFISSIKEKEKYKMKIKNKYNGKLILEKFPLEKKELGFYMNKFKNKFKTEEEFNEFVLSSDDIMGEFEKILKKNNEI